MEFARTENKIRLNKSVHTLLGTEPPIIKMEVDEHEFLEVEDIEAVRKVNLELSEGKPFCVLLDTSKGYFNVSPDANKLLTSKAYTKNRLAAAFIVKSLPARLAGNFFMTLGKGHNVAKMFSTEKEALVWLKSMAK